MHIFHWLAAVSLLPHNCQVTQAVQVELMSDLGFSLLSPEQKREVTEALLLTAQHPIRPQTVSWLLGTGGGFTEGEKVVLISLNRAEWLISNIGCHVLVSVSVCVCVCVDVCVCVCVCVEPSENWGGSGRKKYCGKEPSSLLTH